MRIRFVPDVFSEICSFLYLWRQERNNFIYNRDDRITFLSWEYRNYWSTYYIKIFEIFSLLYSFWILKLSQFLCRVYLTLFPINLYYSKEKLFIWNRCNTVQNYIHFSQFFSEMCMSRKYIFKSFSIFLRYFLIEFIIRSRTTLKDWLPIARTTRAHVHSRVGGP